MVITGWVPSSAPQSGWVGCGRLSLCCSGQFFTQSHDDRHLGSRCSGFYHQNEGEMTTRWCMLTALKAQMILSVVCFWPADAVSDEHFTSCFCVSTKVLLHFSHANKTLSVAVFQKPRDTKSKSDRCRPQKIVQNQHFQVNGCFCVVKSANENHFRGVVRRRQLIR